MKIGELINRFEYVSVKGDTDSAIAGLVCDSRYVRPGYMFVAIAGYQQDGWAFAGSAIERGATVVVSEHNVDDCKNIEGCGAGTIKNICFVQVADSKLALAKLSSAFYGDP
ncbi:MAG: UDP-N-acetylmuramoyl-L-alanyl-D-glutamate--2,6-diaminopimelate ligase, partial [Kiritimatiellae bacterium]|nr:UDP-N-acetylmuramoyl-L-alanyl-D-glutamate--2,6-diaminopimelate ligase [Kiritimatiellia bacterium]